MGEAVGRTADVAVVTNDNPRSESPDAIAEPVAAGLESCGQARISPDSVSSAARGYVVELDRARAIELAVLAASPGDTVVVCGKGHETYQIFGDRTVAFDDRAEARRALSKRRARAAPPSGP